MHIIEVGGKGLGRGYAFVVVPDHLVRRAVAQLQKADRDGLFDIMSFQGDELADVLRHVTLNQPPIEETQR